MLYIRRVFKGYSIQIWNINRSKFNNRSRFNQNIFNNHDNSSNNDKNSPTNKEININGPKIRINHNESTIRNSNSKNSTPNQSTNQEINSNNNIRFLRNTSRYNDGKSIKESRILPVRLPVTVEKAKLAQPPASDLQEPDLGATTDSEGDLQAAEGRASNNFED